MTYTCYPHRTLSHQNAPNRGTKRPQKRHRTFSVSVLESHLGPADFRSAAPSESTETFPRKSKKQPRISSQSELFPPCGLIIRCALSTPAPPQDARREYQPISLSRRCVSIITHANRNARYFRLSC